MTTNLVNLNVDTLFEQHSVPEIDIVQKKIQAVVENKREELRTMVGERYRDLLQAADTIASMQTSAGALITQIEEITTNCARSSEQQLIGFKTNDSAEMYRQRAANKELNSYFSTMVQIKLLTSLPEMIWSNIDQEHFYAATELFIFSRHISTGLQLDANNDLLKHLPVAKKQWEMLKPFHTTIKQNIMAILEREDLNVELAADCLLSLLLLEKSSFNGAIKTFLQLRCSAFLTCLSYSVNNGDVEVRRIKERILASLRVLNGTISLLSKRLLKNGLLLTKLATLSSAQSPPTVALTDEAQYAHLLPEIIANFRPKFDLQALNQTQAAENIVQWLQDTKRIAGLQLKQLLNLVTNITTIQDIKLQANEYKKELDLTEITAQFELNHSLDFFDTYYVPLINQRVRDIIEHSLAQAISAMLQAVEQSLTESEYLEQNIWQEQPNDLPVSLELALSDDRKQKCLLMRTKGYDATILKICDNFDMQIGSIITEMNVLLEERNSKSDEKIALVEFLKNTAKQQLTKFLEKLKSLNLDNEPRKQLLFIVRICVALIELCPNLKICFCNQIGWRQWIGGNSQQTTTTLEHWQKICQLFEEEILGFWSIILDGILAEQNCQQFIPTKLTHVVLLEDFVLWETITLEQKDELDDTISSSFRIPNQPRISLQAYLFNLIHNLNLNVPQTLPSKVLTSFNQKILTQLLTHYESFTALPTLPTNQSIALQLYFDLKFLQSSFNVSRENRLLTEQFQKLQTTFKDFVDPFDFELFAEHIAKNVKRSVSRLSCELGVLLPVDKQMSGASNVSSTLTQEKDPNVLSLSTNASSAVWFPLLPIVKMNANKSESTVTHTEKPSTAATPSHKSSSRKGNNDPNQKPKSGATSFFGAMSQEWFR